MSDGTGGWALGLRVTTAGLAGLFLAGLLRPPIAATAIRRSQPLRLVLPAPSVPAPVPTPGAPWAARPVGPVIEVPVLAVAGEAQVSSEALATATCDELLASAAAPPLGEDLRLPSSPLYDLRCRLHAHAASYTANQLVRALTDLRAHYTGQIVIGDVSRRGGGAFGPHHSHRTGHDVDLWLPVIGGSYRSDATCASCGTRWCRPEPQEIDWAATWSLVRALAATDAVEHIFIDRALHPELRAAALAAGVTADEAAQVIQRRPGVPALVMHSARHTRHMHVRFARDPAVVACERAAR